MTKEVFKFDDFVINEHESSFLHRQKVQEIEPKVYDLLLYFCKNPNEVIDKERLISEVWKGSVVTDNAITRAVAKLRKILQEDAKSPKYLKTVSKRGYLFCAKINVENSERSNDASENKQLRITALIAVIFPLMAASAFLAFQNNKPSVQMVKEVVPLKRNENYAWYPRIDNSGELLSYVEVDPLSNDESIVIESISKGKAIRFNSQAKRLKLPAFSPDSNEVAFVEYDDDQCSIVIARIPFDLSNNLTVDKRLGCFGNRPNQLIYHPSDAALMIIAEINNQSVVATVSIEDSTSSVLIPEFKDENDVIESPYFFDLSNSGDELLVLYRNVNTNTRLRLFDLPSAQLIRTTQFDSYIERIVLSADGKTLVHPTNHPSYQLWRSDLDGNRLTLEATIANRIDFHSRIPNSEDMIFSAYLNNSDLYRKSITDTYLIPLSNSSVMDYLPALQHKSPTSAFVSKRSGKAQVWLSNITMDTLEPITQFEDRKRIYQLEWSPDDSYLLIITTSEIFVYDSETQTVTKLPLSHRQRRQSYWAGKKNIVYQVKEPHGWSWKRFDFAKGMESKKSEADVPYMSFLLKGISSKVVSTISHRCKPNTAPDNRIKKNSTYLFCFSSKNKGNLLKIDLTSGEVTVLIEDDAYYSFDVNQHEIVFGVQTSLVADLMMVKSRKN